MKLTRTAALRNSALNSFPGYLSFLFATTYEAFRALCCT